MMPASPAVAETTIETGTGDIFALRAAPAKPRGLILALHGGGYDANYWHHPGCLGTSLLSCGAVLGFDTIAVDRPGVRRSQVIAPRGASIAEQVELLFDLLNRVNPGNRLPAFIVGHSLGGITALRMAVDPRSDQLAAVACQGVPIGFTSEAAAGMRENLAARRAAGEFYLPDPTREMLEAMFYGPPGRYDPKVVAWGPTERGAGVAEIEDVMTWVEEIDMILPRLTLPVHWTFAQFEAGSIFDQTSLPYVAGLLSGNPHVEIEIQRETGHNISLQHVGRAFHLRIMAFFEEVMALTRF